MEEVVLPLGIIGRPESSVKYEGQFNSCSAAKALVRLLVEERWASEVDDADVDVFVDREAELVAEGTFRRCLSGRTWIMGSTAQSALADARSVSAHVAPESQVQHPEGS